MWSVKTSVDYLMKNYPVESDSAGSVYESVSYNNKQQKQTGGAVQDQPTGGFPPIYLCEKGESGELFEEEAKKKREYTTHKSAVSLKDILEKRRKATPFVNI